jgi:hypothetical protein
VIDDQSDQAVFNGEILPLPVVPEGGVLLPLEVAVNVRFPQAGRYAEGLVIGATDRRGEHPAERCLGVGDYLATLHRHRGIDAEHGTVRDPAGGRSDCSRAGCRSRG